MSAQAVASVLPDFSDGTLTSPATDQVEVSTFDQSSFSAQSSVSSQSASPQPATTAAAAIGESYGLDGSGQTIAIIDTGIAFDHVALGGGFGEGFRVVGGYDFAEDDANPYDDGPTGFHGTHVAGIVGSSDLQFRGVSPGADLVALRVFDDFGVTQLEWIEQSLQWVHDNQHTFENPITTVNLSLGTTPNEVFLEVLNDELRQLEADGIFISVAAGNSFASAGESELAYPASSEFVVPVASHGRDGQLSDFSQRASHVLTAPGESITSTVPDHLFFGSRTDSFLGTSGTSQAAPYVAGASALLRQAYQIAGVTDIDQDLLYDQFIATADTIYDSVTDQNYSQINLAAAIESVLGPDSTVGIDTDDATANETASSIPDSQSQQSQSQIPPQSSEVTNTPDARSTDSQSTQRQSAQRQSAQLQLADNVLRITGTSGDDHIQITADDDLAISINGRSQRFDLDAVDRVVFDGNQGDDSITVELAGTDDQVMLLQNRVEIRNDHFSLTAVDIQNATVDNGDGQDRLFIEGSEFNDVVKASGRSVMFSNEQFAASGGAFRSAFVLGAQGSDLIELEGSRGQDRFAHGEERTFFRSEQLELVARGFENVSAQGNGGNDVANLIGTSADDVFNIDQTSATVTGGRSDAVIETVQRINVINADGNDQITLNGSAGDDRLHARDNAAWLIGDQFSNYVNQISNLTVNASDGSDAAYLLGTAGDDHFEQSSNSATLSNAAGRLTATGFDLVVGRSTQGNDTASFTGTDNRENYFANLDTVQSTDQQGRIVRAIGFDRTIVDGRGGEDAIALRGGTGNETLQINVNDLEFETTLQLLRLTNVQRSQFTGGGGTDRVELNDVESLNLLRGLGDGAEAVLQRHTAQFFDIDEIEANAVDDAIAAYDLESVDFRYNLNGRWQHRD
jgi:subtilisin family serine protease